MLPAVGSYLDKILESVRGRMASDRRLIADLEKEARAQEPPRDFLAALMGEGVSLIAELKRRSPSAGEIRPGADPALIASAYESAGAGALSILTEPEFFGGSLEDLRAARGACSLPALRKDFIVEPLQIVEARAAGADSVLLIVAALAVAQLKDLVGLSYEWEMPPLVEAHDERELEAALHSGATIIGINQRDLRTFEVDRQLAARLRPLVPEHGIVVAESGISTRADVEALAAAGVDAVLVGESLMRHDDPGHAAAALLGRS